MSGEGVVSWTEWYYVSDTIDIPDTSPSIENGWSENQIPDSFYEDSGLFYLWNRTQVNYDSGREILTDPILIMSSPKSINNIECLYGQSISIQTPPTKWSNDIPDDFIVLWKQETTNFTVGESKTIITPIAVKGNPGVDILGNISLSTIDTWTSTNMSDLDSAEYWFKKAIVVGKDLYIWIGSQNPSWLNQEDVYQTSTELCWIIIKDAFTTNVYADWLENDSTKLGYVKNRTHYEGDIVKTYNLNLQSRNLKHYATIEHNVGEPHIDFEIVNFEIDNSDINDFGEFEKVTNKIWRINGTSISLEIINNSELYLYHNDLHELEEYIPISITIKYNVLKKLDPKFVPQMIEITYDELFELRNSKQLIPGMQYRITDYMTTTIQENTRSAYHQFDVIVTADSESVLNENARAIQHDSDDYFSGLNLNAWEIKYCLDNDQNRFGWTPKYTYGIHPGAFGVNDYYSDETYICPIIYSVGSSIEISKNAISVNNGHCTITLTTQIGQTTGDVIATFQGVWEVSLEELSTRNSNITLTFVGGDQSDIESYIGKTCVISRLTMHDIVEFKSGAKGVIYYMKDEFNNECPYDFKNIQFARWELSNPVGFISTAGNMWVRNGHITTTTVKMQAMARPAMQMQANTSSDVLRRVLVTAVFLL